MQTTPWDNAMAAAAVWRVIALAACVTCATAKPAKWRSWCPHLATLRGRGAAAGAA